MKLAALFCIYSPVLLGQYYPPLGGLATSATSGLTAALPATCGQGQVYIATDTTAGANWYLCTAANTWTQQSGGGGSSVTGAAVAAAQACVATIVSTAATCNTQAGDFAEQDGYAVIYNSTITSPANLTLNVDGDGASQIWEAGKVSRVLIGDLQANLSYYLLYDATDSIWVMQSPPFILSANVAGGVALTLANTIDDASGSGQQATGISNSVALVGTNVAGDALVGNFTQINQSASNVTNAAGDLIAYDAFLDNAGSLSTNGFGYRARTNGGTYNGQVAAFYASNTSGAWPYSFLSGDGFSVAAGSVSALGVTLSGVAPGSSSGNGTAAPTILSVSAVSGGATSATGAATGGVGSTNTITGGAGGAATGVGGNTTVGGAGGAVNITAGNGGAGSAGNNSGGAGGKIVLTPGTGGAKTGTGTAGAAGLVQVAGSLNLSTLTASSGLYLDANKVVTNTAPASLSLTASTYSTATNCSSSASPAVCGSAAAGSVAIPTGVTSVTLQVNTSAVTANSQILLVADDTLSTQLSVTCNSTLATLVGGMAITARTAATSFTITYNGTIATNPLCVNYLVIN
jgi:hypothetical protein